MVLVDLTSTPIEGLPLAALKAHLKLGSGFGDDTVQDDVIESYLRASMIAIEARIGKRLMTRRFNWTLTRWSAADCQPLPVAPVGAIVSLTVTNADGTETMLDGAAFRVEPDTHRPQLRGKLPNVPSGGSVTVTLEAGFGPDWADVPADLGEAVFLLAAHYYEQRHDTTGAGGLMPFGIMGLLEPHRNIRIFGG